MILRTLKKFWFHAALLCFVVVRPGFSQVAIDHWESVIYAEDLWRYFPGAAEPDSRWRDVDFDDSGWLTGAGGIGYGDDDDRTIIEPVISLYMRRSFAIHDTSVIARAVLNIDYDDAFVAYLNGQEIARANIGVVGDQPPHDQVANSAVEARMYSGGQPEYHVIERSKLLSLLEPGDNLLAIQVHNQSATSSDLSAIPYLSLAITAATASYRPTPSWFEEPFEFISSNLPILLIDTEGKAIENQVRIPARLEIKDTADGGRNVIDQASDFQSRISIEIRGSSSAGFEKKSYGFETQDENGGNLNVSLLGMPEENDWILYGPYSDKSLLRNAITFHLGRAMGRYASRLKFCELVINGDYKGLYILMEKIKRDVQRVNIDALFPDDRDGDDLTGGYIIKVDKLEGDFRGWTSHSNPPGGVAIFFQYVYPDHETINLEQEAYIQEYILEFEKALNGYNYRDPQKGYAPYVDLISFIDMYIINELTKNIDCYRFSTFMFKDKNGPLTMGPIWDYNLGFGNVDYGTEGAMFTDGWMYNSGGARMYWWSRMMRDDAFRIRLSRRWFELRRGPFGTDAIFAALDSLVEEIDEAQQRNFRRWPVLGKYVWPNYFFGDTWEEELDYLRSWIIDRLDWMDANMPYPDETRVAVVAERADLSLSIHPNPFNPTTRICFSLPVPARVELALYNILGAKVKTLVYAEKPAGTFTIDFDGSEVAAGAYFCKLTADSESIVRKVLLIK